jgi:ParB family transcriptional regulator, chromosome partitioning protein
MNQKKPPLGRGLDALLGQMAATRPLSTVSAAAGSAAPATQDELRHLPLDVLQRGRYQPRVDMRTESLQELADSMRAQGVIQPIVVRPLAGLGGAASRYEIIAGERRWRAAQLANLSSIPAVIRRVPDESAIAMALIENIQRENLNPLEEARALDRLIREFNVTHQQAADVVGRSRATVTNLLRLLELSPETAKLVEERAIEMGHARALLGLPDKRKQSEVAALVARKGISVRETEALVRRMMQPPAERDSDSAGAADHKDPNILSLQNDLSAKLGATVDIQHSRARGKGKVVISYHSLDELDGILDHMK